MESLIWREYMNGSSDFKGSGPVQDVKELLCSVVQMADLRRTVRYALLDHAEIWRRCQVPAVTIATPNIVPPCLY